jgi:hypothetical protein
LNTKQSDFYRHTLDTSSSLTDRSFSGMLHCVKLAVARPGCRVVDLVPCQRRSAGARRSPAVGSVAASDQNLPELPPASPGGSFPFAGALLNIGKAMPTKPPVIVRYVHRPKRARKRKVQPALTTRIVTIPNRRAKNAEEPAVQVAQAAAPPAAIKAPRIVTARRPRGRFGDVSDMTAEEHQQRGDAAEALFRELTRRVREQ